MNNNDNGGGGGVNDNFSEFSSKAFINVGNSFIPDEADISSKTSYSQILEQIDDIIRLTIRNLNKVFDEELFAPIEKMRKKVHPNYFGFFEDKFENKGERYGLNGFYEQAKKFSKNVYDDAIIKVLKKCADNYKYKDYFKVDEAIPIIDYLEFAISMFKDDYNFLNSYCIANNYLGQTSSSGHPKHQNFSSFLSNILICSFGQPEINTTRSIGGEPPLKRDKKYLTNIRQGVCYKIIMEIFEVIQLFVDERGYPTDIGNSSHLYILPYSSYNNKFNKDFIILFLQCFVDFLKNMNQLNYAFHIRAQDTPTIFTKRGGKKKQKQQNINRTLKINRK